MSVWFIQLCMSLCDLNNQCCLGRPIRRLPILMGSAVFLSLGDQQAPSNLDPFKQDAWCDVLMQQEIPNQIYGHGRFVLENLE